MEIDLLKSMMYGLKRMTLQKVKGGKENVKKTKEKQN